MTQPASDWIDARLCGEPAVHGTCSWCGAHLPPTLGCLNLCDMPTGMSREFTSGLRRVIAEARAEERLLEVLAGCTCPPATLSGYASTRDSHRPRCPATTPLAPLPG